MYKRVTDKTLLDLEPNEAMVFNKFVLIMSELDDDDETLVLFAYEINENSFLTKDKFVLTDEEIYGIYPMRKDELLSCYHESAIKAFLFDCDLCDEDRYHIANAKIAKAVAQQTIATYVNVGD